MLWAIITKEIAANVRSLRFWGSFVACFILILLVCYINTRDYTRQLNDYHSGMQFYEDYLDNYANSNSIFPFILEPPPQLSIWFKRPGGEQSDISIFEAGANIRRVSSDRMIDVLFPNMGLGKMIGIVLGLFCIILTFDSITGERETGTLKLVLSNAIPRDTILLGKWIGQSLCILIPSLFSILCGVLLATFNPLIRLETQDLLSIAGIFFCAILFLNLWCTITLLVSLKTTRSSTSLLVLLGVWTLLTFVIPSVSPYLTERISKIPSLESLEENILRADAEMMRQKDEIGQAYMAKHPDNIAEVFRLALPELEEVGRKYVNQIRRMKESYNAYIYRQARLGELLSAISPYAVFMYAVRDLSDTGMQRLLHFYRYQVKYLNQLHTFRDRVFMELLQKGVMGYQKIDGHLVPRPIYREENFVNRVNHALKWIVILVLYNAVMFLAAYASFLRYQLV